MSDPKTRYKGEYIVDCCLKGLGQALILYTITSKQKITHSVSDGTLHSYNYMPVFPSREDAMNFIKSCSNNTPFIIEECVLMYEGLQ